LPFLTSGNARQPLADSSSQAAGLSPVEINSAKVTAIISLRIAILSFVGRRGGIVAPMAD
jgi:hypothetical protein